MVILSPGHCTPPCLPFCCINYSAIICHACSPTAAAASEIAHAVHEPCSVRLHCSVFGLEASVSSTSGHNAIFPLPSDTALARRVHARRCSARSPPSHNAHSPLAGGSHLTSLPLTCSHCVDRVTANHACPFSAPTRVRRHTSWPVVACYSDLRSEGGGRGERERCSNGRMRASMGSIQVDKDLTLWCRYGLKR